MPVSRLVARPTGDPPCPRHDVSSHRGLGACLTARRELVEGPKGRRCDVYVTVCINPTTLGDGNGQWGPVADDSDAPLGAASAWNQIDFSQIETC
jgi:hypothetical protein